MKEDKKKSDSLLLFSVLVVVILTAAAFSSSLNNDFTNWDDNLYVTENYDIRYVSFENIKRIFSSIYVSNYQPITILSYLIEYQIFKLSPSGYHTTNLIIHLLNVVLVFYLIYIITENIFVSFLVGLFFGIHPTRVESVAWIAERKDVLSAFFLLLSLILYLYFLKKKTLKFYIFSILSFLLSLLSKPMGITLPLILHLIDYLKPEAIYGENKAPQQNFSLKKSFKEYLSKQSFYPKISYWILSVIFIILTLATQSSTGALIGKEKIVFPQPFLAVSYGIFLYLYKLILPINLSTFYPYPLDFFESIPIKYIVIFLFSIILFGLVIHFGKKNRNFIFGLFFFLIILLPVSQIVPVGSAMAADRYTYLSFIGLFYIISIFINWICFVKLKNNIAFRKILFIIISIIILTLSYLTYQRGKIWEDSMTLWNDVISKYDNVPVAFNNRGILYGETGKFDLALKDFNSAIELAPDYEIAFNNRGNLFFKLNRFDEAIKDFDETIKLNPKYYLAFFNRGMTYFRTGKLDKAIEDFNKSIKLSPRYIKPYMNRGLIYRIKKDYKKALSDFSFAIDIDRNNYMAYHCRGEIYLETNELEKAEQEFSEAIKINPMFLNAYKKRAEIYNKIGNKTKAETDEKIIKELEKLKAEALKDK